MNKYCIIKNNFNKRQYPKNNYFGTILFRFNESDIIRDTEYNQIYFFKMKILKTSGQFIKNLKNDTEFTTINSQPIFMNYIVVDMDKCIIFESENDREALKNYKLFKLIN